MLGGVHGFMVMVCGVGVMNTYAHKKWREESILARIYIFGEDTGENGNGGMHSISTFGFGLTMTDDRRRRQR